MYGKDKSPRVSYLSSFDQEKSSNSKPSFDHRKSLPFINIKFIDTENELQYNSTSIHAKVNIVETLNELKDHSISSGPSINRLKVVIKALEVLSRKDNYKEEIKTILYEIRKGIFINKSEVQEDLINYIYDNYEETIKDLDGDIPYFCLFRASEAKKDKNTLQANLKDIEFEEIKSNFQTQIDDLEKTIISLKNKLEQNTHNQVIESLKSKNEMLALKIKEQLHENVNLSKEITMMKQKLEESEKVKDEDNLIIIKLQAKIKTLNDDYTFIKERHEIEIKQFVHSKAVNEQMTGSMSTMLQKLKNAYELNEELEKQLSVLQIENSELAIRGAAGFEDLTPRPNVDIILADMGFETLQDTTKAKVDDLRNKLKFFMITTKTANTKNEKQCSLNVERRGSRLTDSITEDRHGTRPSLFVPALEPIQDIED